MRKLLEHEELLQVMSFPLLETVTEKLTNLSLFTHIIVHLSELLAGLPGLQQVRTLLANLVRRCFKLMR